jgi:hypothetical protein
MQKTVYEWAIEFNSIGIAVFPVYYRNKSPKTKWEQYQQLLPSLIDIKRWFLGGSLHNYGVVAGWDDLVILDFDSMDKYYEWSLWTILQPKDSVADMVSMMAFKVKTARGVHVYLRIPGVNANSHIEGLDIKRHGYVIGPGSVHPTGAVYTAFDDAVIIPAVPSLESVLPAAWVDQLQNPEMPDVLPQFVQQAINPDPFDLISNPLDIQQDLIIQIRQRHKLQDYLPNATSTGGNFLMCCCPFHADKNPSFWIDEKRQIGNCQKCNFPKPFDVINLYARMHQISEKQAIIVLAHQ